MRRHVRNQNFDSNDYGPLTTSHDIYQYSTSETADLLQLENLPRSKPHRFENTIEAKVEVGETLQALALRFHCTVADIKRLNKIDKDNEIYARKVVKIPVTVQNVLLNTTLPAVHKSGNNSPKHALNNDIEMSTNLSTNPLELTPTVLSEKLLVASVNAAEASSTTNNINQVILNSKLAPGSNSTDTNILTDSANLNHHDANAPLLSGILDDDIIPQIRPIRGPSMHAIDWSGSDCDMSWVCLFVLILALCFAIPLIYVFYVAEQHNHNHTTH